jgi:hypothetical protein
MLQDWLDYYNHLGPHRSLNDKTPWEKWGDLFMQTPYYDEVKAAFDESKERLRLQNYINDLSIEMIFVIHPDNYQAESFFSRFKPISSKMEFLKV